MTGHKALSIFNLCKGSIFFTFGSWSVLRHIIYSKIYTQGSIYMFFFFSFHTQNSGAKSVRVCWSNGSAGGRERIPGGHLHSWAWPSRGRGFLGVGPVWTVGDPNSGRSQRHHLCARALHVAATELRPGEDAHLRGAPPNPANRVQNTLHVKCSV